MRKVKIIEPLANETRNIEKLNVAAYCRVSTDNAKQLDSLDAQIRHYESYIKSNNKWTLAGVYYDEGMTGTSKDKRTGLFNLIKDCKEGKVNLIITKSISRLARNTADCLELVRSFTELGVYLYFEKENINTQSMESELMLSILAGLAENESLSISENTKWSIRRRFQNGTYKVSDPPYGYDAQNGKLVINEEEANIVRHIFSETLAGKGGQKIANELNKRNIKSKRNSKWTANTILGMLQNERYIGDALYQKTYMDSNYKRHTNYGERDMYYIRDNHSPIISREDFEATALVLEQRAKEKNITKEDSKYLNRYAFSGKINCKHCGANFRRRTHTSGRHPIAWCCFTHISNIKACPMKYIPDSSFKHAFITMFNKLVFGYEKILIPLYASLQNFNNEDNLKLLEDIEIQLKENNQQRDVLVELLAKNYLDPAIYRESNNKLLQEAKKLQEEKNTLNRMITSSSEELKELNKLLLFLAKADMINNFEDKLFNDFVKDISVFSREEININLKCGLSLKERLVI